MTFEQRWWHYLIYGGEMPPLVDNLPVVPLPDGWPFKEDV